MWCGVVWCGVMCCAVVRRRFYTVNDHKRGTPSLHLNEPSWIIDGFFELIVDFLFALVLFLDSTQPGPP